VYDAGCARGRSLSAERVLCPPRPSIDRPSTISLARECGHRAPVFEVIVMPAQRDLAFARRYARDLLRAVRSGSPNAVDQLGALPRLAGRDPRTEAKLADCQLVAARNLGWPSWPALVRGLTVADPLWHLCHSPRLRAGHPQAPEVIEEARALLAAGADPNATARRPDGRPGLSTLYGAAGRARSVEMTKLLLEAGANPDDGESLAHAASDPDPTILRLLLDAGARVAGSGALDRVLDFDHTEGLRLLLEHGDEALRDELQPALHKAIAAGRAVDAVELLLAHGADPGWRDEHGHDAADVAMRAGRPEVAGRLGADGPGSPERRVSALVGACRRGDAAAVDALLAASPGLLAALTPADHGALCEAAWEGADAAVALMLRVGFPTTARGRWGATPLHLAGFRGHASTVRLLLEAGADIRALSEFEPGTPLDWAAYGSRHATRELTGDVCSGPDADYVVVVRMLLDRGASWTYDIASAATAEVASMFPAASPSGAG
jgi:ankyrin repeat protein